MLSSLLQKAGLRPGLALHSAIPKVLMAAAILGGAGSMLSAGSAQAIVTCDFGGFGANDCAVGTQFILGDKKLTIVTLPTAGSGTVSINTPSTDIFNVLVDFPTLAPLTPTVSNATFSYDLEIFTGTKYFSGARLDSLNSSDPVTEVVKTEILGPAFAPLVSLNGIPDPLSPPLPFYEPIPGNLKKIRVLDTYSVSGLGELSEFSNTFRQSDVPGPLPLMGAGMAFGFSRKLRSRIKASASA